MTDTDLQTLGDVSLSRFTGLSTFLHADFDPRATDADIALIGIPYDFQGGRGSAKLGPSQIREMSRLIRPLTFTGVQPFDLCRVVDAGDSPINPMDPHQSVDLATAFVKKFADNGTRVVAAGGDHGATYMMIKGLAELNDGPIGLVHFDAHPDTYGDPFGPYVTHGNAVRLAIEHGFVDAHRTVSVGIHGTRFLGSDRDYHLDAGMGMITIDDFTRLGTPGTIDEIRRIVGDGPTYVTVDIDVLDTPYALGTGAPEPGGFSMRELLDILRGLQGLDIVGADVMEVAPPFDPQGHTALCAANIMMELVAATALSVAAARESR